MRRILRSILFGFSALLLVCAAVAIPTIIIMAITAVTDPGTFLIIGFVALSFITGFLVGWEKD